MHTRTHRRGYDCKQEILLVCLWFVKCEGWVLGEHDHWETIEREREKEGTYIRTHSNLCSTKRCVPLVLVTVASLSRDGRMKKMISL